ncbi:MAG: ClpXP protease specificity-enhancing factor [Pseudomonadota bacterium]
MNALDSTSTRPYLIRALYDWCTDNGLTPYVAVMVDDSVQVPREYVKNNEIVLNISFDATSSLKLGNEFIEFKARFAGTAREIIVPVARVIAIYARENGQGMAFPAPVVSSAGPTPETSSSPSRALSLTGSDLATFPSSASTSESGADARVVQLVPDSGVASTSQSDESPEPPKTPGGKRPSLKRVK